MKSEYLSLQKSHILYDAERLDHITPTFFSDRYWHEDGAVLSQAPGRGSTLLVEHKGTQLALRHYLRGGLPARISRDQYLWQGLERSRPWREFHLLAELYGDGLPVPPPVAAHVRHSGLLYRGDLVTEVIPGRPMAEWLSERRLSTATMHAVGACIHLFHSAGVDHADLNARNILIDDHGNVALIDFDRSVRRTPAKGWQQGNIKRLRRSLDKFRHQRTFYFDDEDWRHLMAGYQGKELTQRR